MRRARHLRILTLAAALTAAGACNDGPPAGPGTVTATLVSPNGAEGAAVLSLFGEGIGDVSAVEGRVWSLRHGDSVRVVVVRDGAAGELSFRIALADTTRKPDGVVLQVAGPDDRLRASLGEYKVEVRR